MPAPTLHVQLESELPRAVSVGAGTAIFLCGWCFCPEAEISSLAFVVDGELQPVAALGMPRLDPFRALHPGLDPFTAGRLDEDPDSLGDPQLRSYRSGFWGLVKIEREREAYELALRAELAGGSSVTAPLGRIEREPLESPLAVKWPPAATGARVAIAMATYNPPRELLERQLESIRAQSHENWVCVISDDGSRSELYEALEGAIADDPRFVLTRAPRRLGFYRNFERALALVPSDAELVAMADQDDAWRPEKLARLIQGLGSAELVYSDARVVSREGELLSETWWNTRSNNHSDLLSLLVANAVTGAASLFRRELLEFALPFPPAQFAHFHDHWVGLVALARGEIAYVAEPLYDYVQHDEAALGHAGANRLVSIRARLARRRPARERIRLWRLHYFVDVWRLRQFATILLMRGAGQIAPSKRRVLEGFLAADRSLWPVLTLAARGLRDLSGRNETLGAEWALSLSLAWRRMLELSSSKRPRRGFRLDALPPPSLIQPPGRTGLDPAVAEVAAKVEPLRWSVSSDAPTRVNLLLPTIDLQHFFGGYIAKFNLAMALAARGVRVRVVTVDPVGALPGDWRARLEAYAGLEGLLDRVEIVFGREASALECSPSDGFIATTWWTAHIAREALEHVSAERFVYLIQEYEPFTFPMGTYSALAAESYRMPHFPLYSSELLRGYFAAHGLGVHAGSHADERDSAAFQNAITRVRPPAAEELRTRGTRRLLFYARPEPHAARNMFELGVLALSRALERGLIGAEWELHGIGAARGGHVSLGTGQLLRLLPRAGQSDYGALLRDHDLGLALMYTPHPSLVPIEMASAGMLTVTNTFENKTADALAAISSNLIAAEPAIDAVSEALGRAAAAVGDVERRLAGSRVGWSTSWEESFGPELLERLLGVLGLETGAT